MGPDRLGFFGHSGGAFQGAVLSAVEPRLNAIVASNSQPYLKALNRFDPAHYVAMSGRRRLFFQHGREDTVVSRTEAVRLYEAAAPPRRWSKYACGHGTDADPDARRELAQFFSSLCGYRR